MAVRQYLCIDQKSFYATVECVARGLDPMTTDLVVADPERSENTICLAVSPSLKAKGVSNRCRIKEIPKYLKYIVATPRMQLYIDCAAEIYGVFLKYVAPEDIHVYSIDESFLDVTPYLTLYRKTARELAKTIIEDIRNTVGTVSTCGIGTNLYLAKIALDIHAKHAQDFIAELDEESYRATLWDHRPITDFWRISTGTEARLRNHGISTMREIAMMQEDYPIRRICLCCNNVVEDRGVYQLNMFDDITAQLRTRAIQETMLGIKAKYGKNAILKGMNYDPAATGRERNLQIGGHKSNG